MLKIYCDGACKGNPGEAGSGIVVYEDNKKPILIYGKYIKQGTNNIAELNALNRALEIAKKSSLYKIEIFCDSKYSIDAITKWSYGWKSKGWTKKGGEIKNLSLIKNIHNLYDSIKDRVKLIYVKGHSGIEGNELADKMAVYAIKKKEVGFVIFKYN